MYNPGKKNNGKDNRMPRPAVPAAPAPRRGAPPIPSVVPSPYPASTNRAPTTGGLRGGTVESPAMAAARVARTQQAPPQPTPTPQGPAPLAQGGVPGQPPALPPGAPGVPGAVLPPAQPQGAPLPGAPPQSMPPYTPPPPMFDAAAAAAATAAAAAGGSDAILAPAVYTNRQGGEWSPEGGEGGTGTAAGGYLPPAVEPMGIEPELDVGYAINPPATFDPTTGYFTTYGKDPYSAKDPYDHKVLEELFDEKEAITEEELDAKMASMDTSYGLQAAGNKEATAAQYGNRGFANSSMAADALANIDVNTQAKLNEAKLNLWWDAKVKNADMRMQELDAAVMMAKSKSDHAAAAKLAQMALDESKKSQMLEQFYNAPDLYAERLGAENWDDASLKAFNEALIAAYSTGDPMEMAKLASDVVVANGVVYYKHDGMSDFYSISEQEKKWMYMQFDQVNDATDPDAPSFAEWLYMHDIWIDPDDDWSPKDEAGGPMHPDAG